MAITMGAVTIRAVPGAAARAKRVALVLAIVVVGAFVAPYATASDTPSAVPSDTWTVADGETLWSIANSITESGHSVRDTVDDIKALNALESSSITAGQQLLVPALD